MPLLALTLVTMTAATVALAPEVRERVEHALRDPRVRKRYLALVAEAETPRGCRVWLGAITGRGHGRFWVGELRGGKDVVMVAHRFGFALAHGLDVLEEAEAIAHSCDEPSCQRVDHAVLSTVAQNTADGVRRRTLPGSPLRDRRGPRARAIALREVARSGGDLATACEEGTCEADRLQEPLFNAD